MRFDVRALDISPDGEKVVIGCGDKKVRFYDAATLASTDTFRVHDGAVTAVAFHPTRPLLVTGSEDREVKIWNFQTRQRTHVLQGCLGAVTDLRFSPDGSLLGAYADNNELKVWRTDPDQAAAWDWPGGGNLKLIPLNEKQLPPPANYETDEWISTKDSGRALRMMENIPEISRAAELRIYPVSGHPHWNSQAAVLLGHWMTTPPFVVHAQSETEAPYIEIRLPERADIRGVMIDAHRSKAAKNIVGQLTLQISDDQSSWRKFQPEELHVFRSKYEFESGIAGRYLRIGLRKPGTFRLWNVNVFGYPLDSPKE